MDSLNAIRAPSWYSLAVAVALLGCGRSAATTAGDAAAHVDATPRDPCAGADDAWSIPPGCSVRITRSRTIDATLTIGAGARLAFDRGVGWRVNDGAIVAQGSASAPIVLTSSASTPAPGDWDGIQFKKTTKNHVLPDKSVLEHVVIEYGRGVAIEPIPNDVRLDDVAFRHNTAPALDIRAQIHFAGAKRLSFVGNGVSIATDIHPAFTTWSRSSRRSPAATSPTRARHRARRLTIAARGMHDRT